MTGILSFSTEHWRRSIAVIIVWAYAYQLVCWPLLFWATTIVSAFTIWQFPAPPIVPWEQLMAGTTTLAAIGGIQTWRDRVHQQAEDRAEDRADAKEARG